MLCCYHKGINKNDFVKHLKRIYLLANYYYYYSHSKSPQTYLGIENYTQTHSQEECTRSEKVWANKL